MLKRISTFKGDMHTSRWHILIITDRISSSFAAWWKIFLFSLSHKPRFMSIFEISMMTWIISWSPFWQAIISAVPLVLFFWIDMVFWPVCVFSISITVLSCPASTALIVKNAVVKRRFPTTNYTSTAQYWNEIIKTSLKSQCLESRILHRKIPSFEKCVKSSGLKRWSIIGMW